MIVLKSIPLGLGNDLLASRGAHADFVTVQLCSEAITVLVPHLVLLCADHLPSASINALNE